MVLKLQNVEKHYEKFDLQCLSGGTRGMCYRD